MYFLLKNVVAQRNKFMNAHGPMDSYGSHIDYEMKWYINIIILQ